MCIRDRRVGIVGIHSTGTGIESDQVRLFCYDVMFCEVYGTISFYDIRAVPLLCGEQEGDEC